MRFFLPFAESDEEAERVLNSIAAYTGASIPDPRVFSIDYHHNNTRMRAAVGEPAHSYYGEGAQLVIAILQSGGAYAVCLERRGVARGEPILVGLHAVLGITYFDASLR